MYNKEVSNPDYKMAKTRTITATFEDGKTIERVTGRIYTHAVQVTRYFSDGDQTKDFFWCGRPDLMEKKIAGKHPSDVKVAKVTNDPWSFQKLH